MEEKIKARSVPFSQTRTRHASETAEDYVEAVMELIEELGECRVLDLARYFNVSHVTVSRIVKRLHDENLLYSILNHANQFNQYVVIISMKAVKKSNVKLQDLKSRLDSFIDLGIDLPTDDLLRVIITKSFSDKQIKVNVKILEYILKNIDRSYEKIFKLIK